MAIYKRGQGFAPGMTKNKSSKWPEQYSNPVLPDFESDALTTLARLPPDRGKRMKAMQKKRKNKHTVAMPFLPALAAFRDSNPLDLICCLLLSRFLSDSTYSPLTSENK